jgi:CheY-like chemotaxis protein
VSHKILLADDSVTVQKIVTLTFSDEGVDVIPVSTGDDALKRLQSLRPALVMADVSIPGKNGYDICAFIKGHPELKHIPVILLVPAFEPFDEERAARVGADHHLTKPFQSIRTLISTVKSLIEPRNRTGAETIDIEWPDTNPPVTNRTSAQGKLRDTGDILEEALAQDDAAVLAAQEPDTGDLAEDLADEITEKLPPPEPFLPRETAKLSPTDPVTTTSSVASAAYASHWDDDILELDDVLFPIAVAVPAPVATLKPVPVPVTVMNTSGAITQSVKVTALETVTTIPPAVIDDIVSRVAAQVTAQISQQLQQFATRLSQDIVAQLSGGPNNSARPNLVIPPAASRRETDSLLDL